MSIQSLFTTETKYLDYQDIKYIPLDYEEIMAILVQRIKERLPNKWTDMLESNFGMEILEATAYEAMLLAFNVNKYANECFLPTAKTKDAVYNLVKLISYKPSGPSNSKCEITFYLEDTWHNDIIIPKYTRLASSSGVEFFTTENAVLTAGQKELNVQCCAGQIINDTFVATEKPYQKYYLSKYPVCYIESVFVNDIEYKEKSFLDSTIDTKCFSVEYDNEFKAGIYFGDGKYGFNPKKGSIIDVYYNIGGGVSTNVKQNTITNVLDVIRDTTNYAINFIKCTNSKNASGGDSEESLDEVKKNAPSIFRTQYRAVTKQDFKDIVNAIPGVEKAVVLDYSDDNSIGIYGVKVAIVPTEGGLPGTGLKKYISEVLEDKKTLTSVVSVIDPSIVPIDLTVAIRINPQYSSNIVINKLRSKLSSYLSWKNREFGEDVTAEDVYSLINTIEGITYSDSLEMTPQKRIYLLEQPASGSNIIKILDSVNILNANVNITFLDYNNEYHSNNMIKSKDGSNYTLDKVMSNVDSLKYGCRVYPYMVLSVAGEMTDKDIIVDDTSNYLDLSNCLIAFEDNLNDEYTILFRSENTLRLDVELKRDIPVGTKILIKGKDTKPRLSSTHVAGAQTLNIKSTPRFTIGSLIYPMKKIGYDVVTKMVKRSDDTFDSFEIKESKVYKIKKIYIDPKYPFVESEDYKLEKNKVIWLDKDLISKDKIYYMDVLIQIIEEGKPDNKYYVKYVGDHAVSITPNLLIDLDENEPLTVESDSINIFKYEISDVGEITINVIDS